MVPCGLYTSETGCESGGKDGKRGDGIGLEEEYGYAVGHAHRHRVLRPGAERKPERTKGWDRLLLSRCLASSAYCVMGFMLYPDIAWTSEFGIDYKRTSQPRHSDPDIRYVDLSALVRA